MALCYPFAMTKVEQALAIIPILEREQQETIADFMIGAALPVIEFGDEELAKIDAGIAAAAANDFASDADVEKVYARFR